MESGEASPFCPSQVKSSRKSSLLGRMKDALDLTLRDEQVGFRKEHPCTDQIATQRVIMEQTTDWQTPLYECFVDFEKSFDSIDR